MSRRRGPRRSLLPLAATAAVALAVGIPAGTSVGATESAAPAAGPKVPVMRGGGGAVSSVDRDATQAGIDVLEAGGNAVDAAIATAGALGVVEPYTSGIGGGGFFVYYDARTGQVQTINGREAAPRTYTSTTFQNPDGTPMDFDTVVNSGLSVGVPGNPALWDTALYRWGTKSLSEVLAPAERLADKGFIVDQSFHELSLDNVERFRMFPETARVFLRDNEAPVVGTRMRNPDIAKAYRELRTHGVDSLYRGALGRAVLAEVRNPTTAPGVTVPKGQLTAADLRAYTAPVQQSVSTDYRGMTVHGMGVPSSGGIAVGQILNLIEAYEDRTGESVSDLNQASFLHWFSEASATAFADRNRYVGDVNGVPTAELLSQGFADERACGFRPYRAQPRPIAFGSPDGSYADCGTSATTTGLPRDGQSTTSLSVADRWGNVVSFTTTIEQYGGSGITVPGWGFLLNNELTDFDFAPLTPGVPDPNLPGPAKRPRSSMSPTIVVADGKPLLSVGSPGGSTIITTVSQVILEHLDRGRPLVSAIAAPRLSSRNGTENAETAILDGPLGASLRQRGHTLSLQEPIGNAVGIRIHGPDDMTAAAETTRRGGGSAMVVDPR